MGASLSNLSEHGLNGSSEPGLGDIPESCVACVFLYLTPSEICNLACLNRAFRSAASSDAVWVSKLPSNYHLLLHLLSHPDVNRNLSKKDIFAILSRPLPFDEDANKVVWVDQFTGRFCMSISAKAMAITCIEDRRYWNWFQTEESRRLGRRVCNFDQTYGWDITLVQFELSTSNGHHASTECFLNDTQQGDANKSYKRGCWLDCKVGEFIVTESDLETEVRFSMKQIDCTHYKGGLCVDSISIISSELKERRKRGVLK